MQGDVARSSGVVWRPDAATVEEANLTRFMRALGADSLEALHERASEDPAWFNDALIRFLDYRFSRPLAGLVRLVAVVSAHGGHRLQLRRLRLPAGCSHDQRGR